jgi:hypothetical protein
MAPGRGSGDYSAAEPLLSEPSAQLEPNTAISRSRSPISREEDGTSLENARPTTFVWMLTAVAAISGLLFGYEFVTTSTRSTC